VEFCTIASVMPKTKAEFQSLADIEQAVEQIEALGPLARAMLNSLRAARAGGAKIVGAKEKKAGIAKIRGWIKSGFTKATAAKKNADDFGMQTDEPPVTATNRKRKKQPEKAGPSLQ
jgi:hypothetical protein